MNSLKAYVSSSIVQKTITALTGLGLIGFVVLHLIGNLLLLSPKPDWFNLYALKLHQYGPLLTLAEIGLVSVFAIHIVNGIRLKLNHKSARPTGYKAWKSKDGPSYADASSLFMAVSGLVLLIFVVIHVIQFRFGPSIAEGYTAVVAGEQARDLYRLVMEAFHQPVTVMFYVLAMIFLGLHLRHGFWSAFQSLGVSGSRVNRNLRVVGYAVAGLLTIGFLMIPVWVYFGFSGGVR